MSAEPVGGFRHDPVKGFAVVDVVVTTPLDDDEFLRIPGISVHGLGFRGRHHLVVVAGNEQDRPGSDVSNDPFRIESDGFVDVFEGQAVGAGGAGFLAGLRRQTVSYFR